jgi:hypothetical protein
LILGQLWKKNLCINHPIFKKRGIVSQNNTESLLHINVQRKPKPTVKNYQSLGYISYDATTSSWVTFSYELTGRCRFYFGLGGTAGRDFSLCSKRQKSHSSRENEKRRFWRRFR